MMSDVTYIVVTPCVLASSPARAKKPGTRLV